MNASPSEHSLADDPAKVTRMKILPNFLRYALAALAGSAVSRCIPLLLSLKGLFSAPLRLPDGSTDDGYTHLLLMMMVTWPVMCLALSVFNALLLWTMICFGFFNKTTVVSVAIVLAYTIFFALGFNFLAMFVMAASFATGALVSWWIVMFTFDQRL